MIGVIVWSSAAKAKAVIWCEDHGALAYLHGLENVSGADGWPQAGDMVILETELRNELRHAFNVRVVYDKSCSELPSLLRDMGSEEEKTVSAPNLRVVSDRQIEPETAAKPLPMRTRSVKLRVV